MTDGIDTNTWITNCKICRHYAITPKNKHGTCEIDMGVPFEGNVSGLCSGYEKPDVRKAENDR